MRTGVDRGGRLAGELLEGDERVLAPAQPVGALLDERPDERPVLVERRAVTAVVLLEGEGKGLAGLVELAEEVREGAERERTQRMVELWRARRHGDRYRADGPIPAPCRALPLVRRVSLDLSNRSSTPVSTTRRHAS